MIRIVQAPPGICWASDILLGKRDFPTFNKRPAANDEFQKIFEKELAKLDAEKKKGLIQSERFLQERYRVGAVREREV